MSGVTEFRIIIARIIRKKEVSLLLWQAVLCISCAILPANWKVVSSDLANTVARKGEIWDQ